jgi:polycystin 2
LGDFDFVSLQEASPVLGPVYFIAYVFFVFFVLLNMFLAIINDSYSEVKSEENTDSDIEIGSYFKRGYDKMLNKLNLNRDKIIDIQDTIMNADKDGDSKLSYEEIRAELKNKGYTDIEIQAFFAKYDKDGDGNLDFNEQSNVLDEMSKASMALENEAEKLDQDNSEYVNFSLNLFLLN